MDLNIFHFKFCFVLILPTGQLIPIYSSLPIRKAGKKVIRIHSFRNDFLTSCYRARAQRGPALVTAVGSASGMCPNLWRCYKSLLKNGCCAWWWRGRCSHHVQSLEAEKSLSRISKLSSGKKINKSQGSGDMDAKPAPATDQYCAFWPSEWEGSGFPSWKIRTLAQINPKSPSEVFWLHGRSWARIYLVAFLLSVAFGQLCRIGACGWKAGLGAQARVSLGQAMQGPGAAAAASRGSQWQEGVMEALCRVLVRWDASRPSAAPRCWAAVGWLSRQLPRRTSPRLSTPGSSCDREDCVQPLGCWNQSRTVPKGGNVFPHLHCLLSPFPLLLPLERRPLWRH